MNIGRRTVLGAAAVAPLAAVAAPKRDADIMLPDLSFLRDTPLADAERLRREMRAAGLDAIVAAHPANVFYLTNHWPQLDRMGFEGSGIAIFAADPKIPLGLVMHAFLYYYTHTPESDFGDRQVFTYTAPGGASSGPGEPPAQPARTMRVADKARITPLDRHRMAMFGKVAPPSADASWALAKAIAALGLAGKRIGIDDPALGDTLRQRGFTGETAAAENVIRRARQSKSPAELKLMRFAAQANVDAAMAAASRARSLGTSRRLRAEFYAEAARRGNDGHFMVIGGTSSEALDQPLVDGSSVAIDCVSTCRFYHGDFARAIFVGEPPIEVRKGAAAIQVAWQEIREKLRPGMRFADIPAIGREAMKRQGVDLAVSFTPHSVGLFHTDQPNPSLMGTRPADAMVLEENMVLSVDCPAFVAGLGGTIHYEDLMLIRPGGAQAIHTIPPPYIVV